MSKSRTKISDAAFERVATGLVEALERGTEAWPLPEPPMSDPDFPPISPTSPHRLFEQGLGILNIDRGMFDRHLNTVVDLIVPHRMNLSDDPFEIHQKWLGRRMDDVAHRLLFHIASLCSMGWPPLLMANRFTKATTSWNRSLWQNGLALGIRNPTQDPNTWTGMLTLLCLACPARLWRMTGASRRLVGSLNALKAVTWTAVFC